MTKLYDAVDQMTGHGPGNRYVDRAQALAEIEVLEGEDWREDVVTVLRAERDRQQKEALRWEKRGNHHIQAQYRHAVQLLDRLAKQFEDKDIP